MKCPDCGVPLDEIPFETCAYHRDYNVIEAMVRERVEHRRAMTKARLDARPIWDKLRQSDDIEEAIEHLAAWLEQNHQQGETP